MTKMCLADELSDEQLRQYLSKLMVWTAEVVRALDEMSVQLGLTAAPIEFIDRYFEPMVNDENLDPEEIARVGIAHGIEDTWSTAQHAFFRTAVVACAYAAAGMAADMRGETESAIAALASSSYWCGIARGLEVAQKWNGMLTRPESGPSFDSDPKRPHDLVEVKLQELLKEHRRRAGAAGGQARAGKYKPVQEWVLSQYAARKWASARQAAKALAPEALALSRIKGCELSEDRVFDTVYGWIRDKLKRTVD
ncbi:hypothetical protein PQR64_23985 [Paraburkholderia phytofirmans]|uniref:hypothetical protein n=1 Tax=Paraburkholderia phytofirmans TaxID=261302 RepID=UPI0038BDEEB9